MSDSHVPSDVKNFIQTLDNNLLTKQVAELEIQYVDRFAQITDRLYNSSPWPSPEVISPLVHGDKTFLMLYKHLWYRHIFQHTEVTLEHRFHSFRNFIDLLDYLLALNVDRPQIKLPNAWLWDIVDEFIYEFQSYHDFRGAVKSLTSREIDILRTNDFLWFPKTVTSYLENLVRKGENETGMFKDLSQFALIGLARVNTLLCDYATTLELAEQIPRTNNPCLNVVTCEGTLYYTLGLAYLMSRRFVDAARFLQGFISSTLRYGPLDSEDLMSKQVGDMIGLLTLCLKLSPSLARDEALLGLIEDKKQLYREMEHGSPQAAEDAFTRVFQQSVHFVTTTTPNYDGSTESNLDMSRLQLSILLRELRQRAQTDEVASHLKLCKSITIENLTNFTPDSKASVANVNTWLLNLKHKTRTLTQGANGQADWGSNGGVDFYVENDVVHVAEHSTTQRYGDYFVRAASKMDDLLHEIRHMQM
jgi:translation initiation factor 3 subunit L